MKHIFYFFAIIAIMWELMVITSPKRVLRFRKSFQEANKSKKSWDDFTQSQKNYGFLMLMYFVWCAVGIFTAQWIPFVAVFLMAFIPKKWLIVTVLDAIITLSLLFYIILNSYHLHLNTLDIIKSLFV